MTQHLNDLERIARHITARPIRDIGAYRKRVMETAGRITTDASIPPVIRQQVRDTAMILMRRFEEAGPEALANIERIRKQLSGRTDA